MAVQNKQQSGRVGHAVVWGNLAMEEKTSNEEPLEELPLTGSDSWKHLNIIFHKL